MPKTPTIFECQSCGYSSAKWLGRCPDCGGWNSFVEEKRPRSGMFPFIVAAKRRQPG